MFLKPTLFSEIVDQNRGRRSLRGDLPELLARKHGITDAAKYEVARIFMDSARYASVLTSEGVFLKDFLDRWKQTEEQGESLDFGLDRPSSVTDEERTTALGRVAIPILLTDDKMAELTVPKELNESDILLMRSQLDVLEQKVALSRPGASVIPFTGKKRSN